MSRSKKIMALFLSIVMVLGLLPASAFAANDTSAFSDVKNSAWYHEDVQYVSENGLMKGTGENLFSPDATTTRGMIVTILYRLEGEPSPTGACPFQDVASGKYYEKAITWAAENGIVSGFSADTFGPDQNITREQMAAILYRYATYKNYDVSTAGDLSKFPDADKVSSYAVDAMKWANAAGLINGSNDGKLYPAGNATRAQVAAILTRFCKDIAAQCTVTFQLNYGSEGTYTTLKVAKGDTITAPKAPTRSGYTFSSWSEKTSGSAFDFKTPIEKDITLYAQWNKNSGTSKPNSKTDTTPDVDYEKEDTDKDGVPNWLEKFLGISDNNDDSDGDGISDYDELYLVGSDPSNPDSQQDKDGDGLSNLDEVKTYKTNPIRKDTDGDGLTDGDEIKKYSTSPLKEDTDEDGVLDSDEIKLGLNPLLADANELASIEQTLDEDKIDDALLEGNEAIPSISGTSDKVLNRSVSLSKSSDLSLDDNRSVVGNGVDLVIDGDANLELSFTVETDTDTLVVMAMDEEEGWIPVQDTIHKDNTISIDNVKSGTYCVMDLNILLPLLGIDIDSLYNTIMAEPIEDSASSTAIKTNSDSDLIDFSNDSEKNLNTNTSFEMLSPNAASGSVTLDEELNTLIDEEPLVSYFSEPAIMGQADIVFAIDTTGSMSDEISNVANNIIEFVLMLTREYNVNVNLALVNYRDITADGSDSTKVIKNGTSNWYTNVNGFRDAIANLTVTGGGDKPETAVDALEVARRLDFRSTARKFIVLVTDANYKTNNNFGISSMDDEVKLLKRDGIITSVVTDSSYKDTYKNLYTETGGLYANIYGNFSAELLRLADLIGGEVSKDNWILLNNYQYVALKNPLSPTSGDTDGDGLSDYAELKSPQKKNLTTLVKAMLLLHNVPEDLINEYFSSLDEGKFCITVYPFLSNPVQKDTDFDGRDDNEDAVPKSNQFSGKLKSKYATSNVSFKMDYRWFFNDNSTYNAELSKMSLLLSSAIYPENDLGIWDSINKDSTSGASLPTIMKFFGFSTPKKTKSLSDYYNDNHLSEVGVGHRTVTYKGTTKNILAVVVRGTNGTIEEWSSNFDIGNESEYSRTPDWETDLNHAGFDIAANRIMRIVEDYMVTNNLSSSDTVFWITGHSRGAAIANIIGAYYEQQNKAAYTYTFAAPNTTMSSNATSYHSIFNIVNSDDFVPCLPMATWGYTRYGHTASSSVASNYEKEWESLTNIWDYNPDTFGMNDTVAELSKILTGDARIGCYKYTCNDHGDNSNDTITIKNYGVSKESREAAINKIPTNALPYCIITRYDGGWSSGWDFEVCQTPAYFMQVLAAQMAGEISVYRFVVELNIANRYESAKKAIILSAIGGLKHPHYTESYYVLSNHMRASQFT